jgi:hypothetical protein
LLKKILEKKYSSELGLIFLSLKKSLGNINNKNLLTCFDYPVKFRWLLER